MDIFFTVVTLVTTACWLIVGLSLIGWVAVKILTVLDKEF